MEILQWHMPPFLLSLVTGIIVLVQDLGNPDVFVRLCGIEAYPMNCQEVEGLECTRGDGIWSDLVTYLILVPVAVATLISVVCTVRVTQTVLRTTRQASTAGGAGVNAQRRERRVMKQAVLYLLAYLWVLFWVVINSVASENLRVDQVGDMPYFLGVLGFHWSIPCVGVLNYYIWKGRLPSCRGWSGNSQ